MEQLGTKRKSCKSCGKQQEIMEQIMENHGTSSKKQKEIVEQLQRHVENRTADHGESWNSLGQIKSCNNEGTHGNAWNVSWRIMEHFRANMKTHGTTMVIIENHKNIS